MKHYLSIFSSLIRNNMTREMEYRGNFFLAFFLEAGSLLITLLILNIQFLYTNSLAGWSKGQVVLLVGVSKVAMSLIDFSFMRNMRNIPDYVENGELDHYLTKPISAQLFASFRYLSLFKLSGIVAGIGIMIYAIKTFGLALSFEVWLVFLIMMGSGLVIFYSLFLLLASLSFWTTRLSAIGNLYSTIQATFSVPVGVFGRRGSILLTYLIPLGFVVSIPSAVLLNISSKWYMFLSVGVAWVLFVIAGYVWSTGLKRYSGASS